jgi:hypothetical protein
MVTEGAWMEILAQLNLEMLVTSPGTSIVDYMVSFRDHQITRTLSIRAQARHPHCF